MVGDALISLGQLEVCLVNHDRYRDQLEGILVADWRGKRRYSLTSNHIEPSIGFYCEFEEGDKLVSMSFIGGFSNIGISSNQCLFFSQRLVTVLFPYRSARDHGFVVVPMKREQSALRSGEYDAFLAVYKFSIFLGLMWNVC